MLIDAQSANSSSFESSNSGLVQNSNPLQLPTFPQSRPSSSQTIAFVDANIPDALAVMAGLQSDIKVLLDPTRDGIAQITEALGHYTALTGVSIISHGSNASLQLGNGTLSAVSLQQYADELQQWSSSLTPDADVLFYGCNVAAAGTGQDFIQSLSALTGADVAASVDPTGASSQGGDWVLEYTTGQIETETPLTDAFIKTYDGLLPTLFTTQTPSLPNETDGSGSAGDYELGMEFRSAKAGQISAIRYYKSPSETGTHVGRIWSSSGQLLASVTFANETASGWQQQTLATPLTIQPNTTYVVSVNANTYYATTVSGLDTTITNGDLSAVADGSNGVFNITPGSFPTQSWNNSNYFRDVVFTASNPANNNPGSVTVSGTATQNQTLSATVADADGLTGVTINYQWQQSSNGTTWTNITGATSQTLTLGQAQVGNQVRVNAIYTDALGSSEDITSTTTTTVANVNDLGTVAISGITSQGNTLTASVTDLDGLPGAIAYQWQQSSNGTTWSNISGATNQTLSLDSGLVGQQVRVNAIYTDVFGGGENILSSPTSVISAVLQTQSLFTTQTPSITNATDGAGSAGDYELGMEFRTAKAGQIQSIRYYKAPSETGTHVGRIWSSSGQLLASVTFTNETASGWQQQALATPLTIQPNTTYVVSVNANSYYVTTTNGLATTLTNGDISAVADGSNGVFNTTPANFPTQSWNNSNYFRDIVFAPSTPTSNNPGTITVSGTATQNQTLTATVADTDGLNGVTVNYQWQQSSNGTTWTNITGATSQTLILGQAQVGNQVRVNAIYTDTLGSSENISSTATTAVANVNDLGTIAITGTTTQGNTLTATVTDLDGLPGAIAYQWQQFSNSTWTNITGATNQTLSLDSSLVGKQVRVNAIYTDVLGGSENIFSNPTSAISSVSQTQSLLTALTPAQTNVTDGSGSAGDYELGMEFKSAKAGQITAIRYYKASNETGTHVGRIWSSSGQLLASVTFTNETASGWQQQALSAPLTIQADTTYVVSVNANSYYVLTSNGIATTLTNGDLSAVADGSNGVFNTTPASFPTQSWNNSNYFRDIVFAPTLPPSNNNPGTVTVGGTATQNQTLSATVADTDGLTGVTINYQWQQSSNGTTWTNITGATSQTLTLGQAQVGNQVRVNATYIDALGSSENITSTATTAIANVNDLGTVAISGITSQGNTLTATVTDADGLPGTIAYQWQQLDNGTWNNIAGATTKTLSLNSSLVGKQVRVNAIYTDALGGSENVLSTATAPISALVGTTSYAMSVFAPTTYDPTITPSTPNFTDGAGSAGDYELGMRFTSAVAGQIQAIRYYKASSETGTHVGRIWSSTGQLLGSVTFANETASGWQQQALATPISINANTTYVVSVNVNSYYALTSGGFATARTTEALTGTTGVFNVDPSLFPNQVFQSENYFRDVVFTPAAPSANNSAGSAGLSGSSTEDQTLTASVSDANGVTAANVNYQWQELENDIWTDIAGATKQTLKLSDEQVGKSIRFKASYTDGAGNKEYLLSQATNPIVNVNDLGLALLKGSPTTGDVLSTTILDDDGLNGSTIGYQWQQLINNVWTNIAGATTKSLTLSASLLGQQVRVAASYTDALGTAESIVSNGTTVTAQNRIVLENLNQGTSAWRITNLATNNEIAGYASATSLNQGETLPIKVSLAQSGQYRIDVYRLGYYGGLGGRLMATSGLLNGGPQTNYTFDSATRLTEYNWNTSYNLQVGQNWTSGLYVAKLTDINSGTQTHISFVVRDDDQPTDLGFKADFTTYTAYNNYGGYSSYTANSLNGQNAYKVSFDRPLTQSVGVSEASNNMLTWEYNMARWLESQGYDISYYTNLDVHSNRLNLYSQDTMLSVGHDEYWSMEMFDNIMQARDNGINLAFFSANTAYWRVRFEPSTTGQADRTMVIYKKNWTLDPAVQKDISAATTVFRSPELNRPENSLMGVMYVGDAGTNQIYNGFDYVVTNSSDPYYANTGLKNGDVLRGLVGYEWDAVVNNGSTPTGLVSLAQANTSYSGGLPLLPTGTNPNIANAVRYTAASGAKVFSAGTIQWMWGLDSDSVGGLGDRTDIRVKQITTNILADMGAVPATPSLGIVVPG